MFKDKTNFKKVMLDEHARYMIADGLTEAGIEVVPMSFGIQSLRSFGESITSQSQ